MTIKLDNVDVLFNYPGYKYRPKILSLKYTKQVTEAPGSFRIAIEDTVEYRRINQMTDVQVFVDDELEFRGIIEDKEYDEDSGMIKFSGRDYGYRLMRKIPGWDSSNDMESSVAIGQIIDAFVEDITYSNFVETSNTTLRWVFGRGKTVWECIKSIADATYKTIDSVNWYGFDFWVDQNLELHFHPRNYYQLPIRFTFEKPGGIIKSKRTETSIPIRNEIKLLSDNPSLIPHDGDAFTAAGEETRWEWVTCSTCESTCQGCVQINCETACQIHCQTGCEAVCQSGCEVSCQSGCQVSCEWCWESGPVEL